jgi:hypothetical protein
VLGFIIWLLIEMLDSGCYVDFLIDIIFRVSVLCFRSACCRKREAVTVAVSISSLPFLAIVP